jgi:hypothetical protein
LPPGARQCHWGNANPTEGGDVRAWEERPVQTLYWPRRSIGGAFFMGCIRPIVGDTPMIGEEENQAEHLRFNFGLCIGPGMPKRNKALVPSL